MDHGGDLDDDGMSGVDVVGDVVSAGSNASSLSSQPTIQQIHVPQGSSISVNNRTVQLVTRNTAAQSSIVHHLNQFELCPSLAASQLDL